MSAVQYHPFQGGGRVTLRRLSKSYDGKPVLTGLDLEINPGEFLAIVGKSGCGKSTLLRLLAGLEAADAGVLQIEGGQHAVRLMFQEARLLPWRRVLANVALDRTDAATLKAARAALEQVGLGDKADEWPGTLSGGQRQRVALARALLSRPRLLLLDEPLGALDALTRLEMQNLVESVWLDQGCTVVLVTHDVSEAVRLADRVVLLEAGEIAAIYPVAVPHPRPLASAALQGLEAQILGRILQSGSREQMGQHRI